MAGSQAPGLSPTSTSATWRSRQSRWNVALGTTSRNAKLSPVCEPSVGTRWACRRRIRGAGGEGCRSTGIAKMGQPCGGPCFR